jgi:hypothetical protein
MKKIRSLVRNNNLLLIVIICFGLSLRIFFLNSSFITENEAFNLADVHGYRQAFAKLPLLFTGHKNEFIEYIQTPNPKAGNKQPLIIPPLSTILRPGYTFLLLLSSYIVGESELTGKYLNALASVLTILLVYLLGKKMYSHKAGLLGAFFLSLSLYHIAFSRMNMSHLFNSLLVFACFYFHFLSLKENRKSLLFPAGLCLGYALVIHPITLSFIPILWIIEIYHWIKEKKIRDSISRLFVFISGFILPLFVFHGLSFFLVQLFQQGDTYWQRWSGFIYSFSIPPHYLFKELLNFPIYLADSEGYLILAILIWGLTRLLNKKFLSDLFRKIRKLEFPLGENYLEIFIIFYFIIWSYLAIKNGNHYPTRAYLYLIPFLVVMAGKFCQDIETKYSSKLVWFILIFFTFTQLSNCWKVLTLDSGYKEAAAFINKQDPTAIVVAHSFWPIYAYYLGTDRVGKAPMNAEDLPILYKEKGIRYFVTDWKGLWYYNSRNSYYYFEQKYQPVKVIDNPVFGYLPYLANEYYYPRVYLQAKRLPTIAQTIRIYDLKEINDKNKIP